MPSSQWPNRGGAFQRWDILQTLVQGDDNPQFQILNLIHYPDEHRHWVIDLFEGESPKFSRSPFNNPRYCLAGMVLCLLV